MLLSVAWVSIIALAPFLYAAYRRLIAFVAATALSIAAVSGQAILGILLSLEIGSVAVRQRSPLLAATVLAVTIAIGAVGILLYVRRVYLDTIRDQLSANFGAAGIPARY
jgi:hypothetical protein